MHYFPDQEEQEIIIDHIKYLISKIGQEPLITWPIIEPTTDFFPDELTPDGEGAWYLSKRLLIHAGLKNIKPEIAIIGDPNVQSETAAQYVGTEDNICKILVDINSLDNPITLSAVLAHEICHVFRDYHGLVENDNSLEEMLTDLTAICIGFGVLLTNVSHQSFSYSDGSLHYFGSNSYGYLSPQTMSFIFALQFVLRNNVDYFLPDYLKYLGPNQKEFFEKSVRHLMTKRESLLDKLSINKKGDDTATILTERLFIINDKPNVIYDVIKEIEEKEKKDKLDLIGSPITVERFDYRVLWTISFSILSLIISLFIANIIGSMLLPFIMFILVTIIGYFIGNKKYYYICCSTNCAGIIKDINSDCPKCKGKVTWIKIKNKDGSFKRVGKK